MSNECKYITNFSYVYVLGDIMLSVRSVLRTFAHDSHLQTKHMMRAIVTCSFRCVVAYELCSYLSMRHLETRAIPILARQKNNPLKNDLLEKIN